MYNINKYKNKFCQNYRFIWNDATTTPTNTATTTTTTTTATDLQQIFDPIIILNCHYWKYLYELERKNAQQISELIIWLNYIFMYCKKGTRLNPSGPL